MEGKTSRKMNDKLKKMGLQICPKIGLQCDFMGSIVSRKVHDMPTNWIGVNLRVENDLSRAFMVYFWSHIAHETDTFLGKSAQTNGSDSKKVELFFAANLQIYRF